MFPLSLLPFKTIPRRNNAHRQNEMVQTARSGALYHSDDRQHLRPPGRAEKAAFDQKKWRPASSDPVRRALEKC